MFETNPICFDLCFDSTMRHIVLHSINTYIYTSCIWFIHILFYMFLCHSLIFYVSTCSRQFLAVAAIPAQLRLRFWSRLWPREVPGDVGNTLGIYWGSILPRAESLNFHGIEYVQSFRSHGKMEKWRKTPPAFIHGWWIFHGNKPYQYYWGTP